MCARHIIASLMEQCPETAAQVAQVPQQIASVDPDNPDAREELKFATDVMELVPYFRAQTAQFRARRTPHNNIGHGKDVEGIAVIV